MVHDSKKRSKATAATSSSRKTSSSSTSNSDHNGDGWNIVSPRRSSRGTSAIIQSTNSSSSTDSSKVKRASLTRGISRLSNSLSALDDDDDDEQLDNEVIASSCNTTTSKKKSISSRDRNVSETFICEICINSGDMDKDETFTSIRTLQGHIDSHHKDINEGAFHIHFHDKYRFKRCMHCSKTCLGDGGIAQHLNQCQTAKEIASAATKSMCRHSKVLSAKLGSGRNDSDSDSFICSICNPGKRREIGVGVFYEVNGLKNHVDGHHKNIDDNEFEDHFHDIFNLTRCASCLKTCKGDLGLAQHLHYCKGVSPSQSPLPERDDSNAGIEAELEEQVEFDSNSDGSNDIDDAEEDSFQGELSDEERLTLLCATDIPLSQLSVVGRVAVSKISTIIMNTIVNSADSLEGSRRGRNDSLNSQINEMVTALQRLPGAVSLAKRLRQHKRSNKEVHSFLKRILDNPRPWKTINDYYDNNLYHLRDIRIQSNRVATNSNSQGTSEQVEQNVIKKVIKLVHSYKLAAAIEVVQQHLDAKDRGDQRQYLSAQQTRDYINSNKLYPDYDEELDSLDSIRHSSRTPITISIETVKTTLHKLSMGKAAGISGWTFNLLHGLGADHMENSAEFTTALCKLLNVMAANKIDSSVWTKTRLQLIPKALGGLRPITIGETLVRVLGACQIRQENTKIQETLAPFQYGVGVKGGADIIAVTCNLLMGIIKSDENSDNTMGIVPLDFVNAYGSVRRLHTGKAILKHMPQLYDTFLFLYGQKSEVYLINGEHVATVHSGLRQGCSLATLFFCLAIKDALDLTARTFPSVVPFAYIDDITPISANTGRNGDNENETQVATAFLCRELEPIGLIVNVQKSTHLAFHRYFRNKIWGGLVNADCCVDRGEQAEFKISIPESLACKVLGIPTGHNIAVRDMLKVIFDKYDSIIKFIPCLPADIGYVLLKFCISTRPTYLARSVAPSLLRSFAKKFDEDIRQSFFALIETSTSEVDSGKIGRNFSWNPPNTHHLLVELPPRCGGAGLYSIERINDHAYYGNIVYVLDYLQRVLPQLKNIWNSHSRLYSAIPCNHMSDLRELLPNYITRTDFNSQNPFVTIKIPTSDYDDNKLRKDHRQKFLMDKAYLKVREDLLAYMVENGNAYGAAWLRSTPSHPNAFTWMFSAINPFQQLKLKPQSFVDAIRLLLQLPVMQPDGTTRTCSCRVRNSLSYDTGDISDMRKLTAHALCCTRFALCRMSRHNLIVKALKTFLLKCLPVNDSEVRVEAILHDEEGLELPPIDLAIRENHRLWTVDVAITSPTALAVVDRASSEENVAINVQLNKKKHKNSGYRVGWEQRYFILETSGRLGVDAMNLIDEYAKINTLPHDPKLIEARRLLLQEISVIVWRGNSFALRMARQHLNDPSISKHTDTWSPPREDDHVPSGRGNN